MAEKIKVAAKPAQGPESHLGHTVEEESQLHKMSSDLPAYAGTLPPLHSLDKCKRYFIHLHSKSMF